VLITPRNTSFRTTSVPDCVDLLLAGLKGVAQAQTRLSGGGEMSKIPASLGGSVNYPKHTADQMLKGQMSCYPNNAPFCE